MVVIAYLAIAELHSLNDRSSSNTNAVYRAFTYLVGTVGFEPTTP
jgi:hypothetical protein